MQTITHDAAIEAQERCVSMKYTTPEASIVTSMDIHQESTM